LPASQQTRHAPRRLAFSVGIDKYDNLPPAEQLQKAVNNVWELVQDCWSSTYDSAPSDGSASMTGDCSRRVLRGGSWYFNAWLLRSASRIWDVTGGRSNGAGFRVARAL
jgi:formylglycine-generating enzyme required for sulfatase activity